MRKNFMNKSAAVIATVLMALYPEMCPARRSVYLQSENR